MDTTVLTKNSNRFTVAGLAFACLLPTLTIAADVEGGVRIGVSYVDNVFLFASPNEIDDVVYRASPFLSIVHESPNLDAALDYKFDWLSYSDAGTTAKYHIGTASVTGKALQDSLSAELGARRSQKLRDPDDVIPSGRLSLTNNIVDQDEWWFNPRFRQTLGRAVALDAGYRYTIVEYDDVQIQDNDNQDGDLSFHNYAVGEGLTWALDYNWRRTEYEISTPWEYQQATAELGFWVIPGTRVFGSGGKESPWDNPFDSSMEDSFWEAGFAHSASEKLSVEFAAGERSFGSSWRGEFDYAFRRGGTSISYSETPTANSYYSGGERGVVDPDGFVDFLDQPGRAERYISNRFQWDLNLDFRSTGLVLAVFDEERSDRVLADGTLADNQSQRGAWVSFSWQAGVRTEFVASGSFVDQEIDAETQSTFIEAGLDVNYRLGARSEVSLGYSYSAQDPSGRSSGNADYVSNDVSLFFTYLM